MSISEQLSRIIKVAPYLPYQTVCSIGFLIAIPILMYRGVDGLSSDWKKGRAKPIEHTQIQERIREGEPEYFFRIVYSFSINDQAYTISEELGFRTVEYAQATISQKIRNGEISIWYSAKDPNKSTFRVEHTYWQGYFVAVAGLLLPLAYFRWLFLKYFELDFWWGRSLNLPDSVKWGSWQLKFPFIATFPSFVLYVMMLI